MSIDFSQWLLVHDGSAYSALSISSDEVDADFESWFRTNGGYLHPSVELAANTIEGNYLRVKEGSNLPSGSTIVSCPHELTLSWASARKYHFPNIRSQFTSHVATRLFLIKQYLLREHSPWWPYIRSLPQPDSKHDLRTPMFYDMEDMLWIRGTNLEHARDVREDAWRKEYTDTCHILVSSGDGDRNCHERSKVWTWWVISELESAQ